MNKFAIILFLNIIPFLTFAQDGKSSDYFGNIGKIYVVVGVLMILFICVIGLLVFLERKLARLEQEIHKKD
ncbi:MAG: hypothetical protein MK207_11670 [Saprospiraceae bacterium]|nr:hypothetical protein [Saprospiraceae bacterium]